MLTKIHKKAPLAAISKWLTEGHNWHQTAFSDEKRLSLCGLIAGTYMLKAMKKTPDKFDNVEEAVS